MNKVIMAWTLGAGCALATAAAADDAKARTHPAAGATVSATGCLEKDDDPNTYELTDAAKGTEWKLVDAPAALKLAEHVGRKVEVSGTVLAAGEKTADEKGISSGTGSGAHAPADKHPTHDDKGVSSGTGSGTAKMKGQKADHRLKVTSLKQVAATCP
jgi:hypothetical protein